MTTYTRERYNARSVPRPAFTAEQDAWLRQEFQSVQRGIPHAIITADSRDFGVTGNGVTDDIAAILKVIDQTAVAASSNGGMTIIHPGIYKVTGNPFYNRVGQGNCTMLCVLNGARFLTTKQVKLPANVILRGANRLRCGVFADSSFVASAAISTIVRTSNVVTVTTSTPHGLEANATVAIQGVTDTTFNRGVEISTAPTATTFTFPLTGADASDSTGTVYIPLVVLGDGQQASGKAGVRLENLEVDCSNVVDSVGVYSHNLAELAGASDVLVNQAYKYGIWLERFGANTGGPNNYRFENTEVGVTPDVAATGVYIRGTAALHRGFDNITTNTATNTGTSAAGFDVSGAPGVYSRIHCEHATDGFLVGNRAASSSVASGKDSGAIVIEGITGHESITNLVHLKNAGEVHDIVVMAAASYLAVNTLVDDVAGLTLVGGGTVGADDYIGIYAIGGVPTSTRFSTSPNVPWKIAPTVTFAQDITQGSNAYAATLAENINAAAGQTRQKVWQSAGVARWIERVDSTAESGSNAGSNWSLLARADDGSAIDQPVFISRVAGGSIIIGPGRPIVRTSANGAQWVVGQASELLTLSTGGTTTDTSANLLPANAIIEAVVARVTTTITTATDWTVGDPTTANRFAAANAVMTAGSTSIGLRHQQGSITTDATGPVQTAAAKVRITTTGTPSAGVIRLTVFYRQFTAPTS